MLLVPYTLYLFVFLMAISEKINFWLFLNDKLHSRRQTVGCN